GLHKRSQNYEKALERLETLDQDAQKQVGRPFARSFAGHAGCAFILYDKGQRDEAIAPAKAALELAVSKEGPISTHPELGQIPKLPDELLN
ncbi:hypothetical protein, partial [Janibacter hoylei]|uniref:hypothetical protein n=1 Tax=Janibacter hoylei TaxID=364298 RepID=UPI00249104C2